VGSGRVRSEFVPFTHLGVLLHGISDLGVVRWHFAVKKNCGAGGRFADGPEDPEESGAIGLEAGDPVCEEGGEFGGVDGGFEGDAETGGGVDCRV
jgi:hypothetical protein